MAFASHRAALRTTRRDDRAPLAFPRPAVVGAGAIPMTMTTTDGRFITRGRAAVEQRDGAWSALIRSLDRPGQLAATYFGEGVRDVVLRLADGRRGRASIAATSFFPSGERVCRVDGTEPLA